MTNLLKYQMIMEMNMSKYDNLRGVHNEVSDELKSKGFYIDHRLSPRRYVLTKNNKDIYTFKTLKYLDLYITKNITSKIEA